MSSAAKPGRREKAVGKRGMFSAVLGRIRKDVREYWKFGAAIAVYDGLATLLFGAFCPSVIVAGLPCPGCGMTRSVFCFATGQFAKGWELNPLGILWLLLALYFCAMRYGMGKKLRGALQAGGCLAALMAVFWLYRMYRYFPGETPLCYTPGNLLERMWPAYGEWALKTIGGLQEAAGAWMERFFP